MKTTFFVPLLALAARFTLAAMPPACLLHAVNTQDNPADMSGICGKNNATNVQAAIQTMCSGTAVSVAQSAFIASCSVAGAKVASYTPTSTASSATKSGTYIYTTAVYNSSCSCTQTIVTSAAGSTAKVTSGGASATASGTGSAGAVSSAGAVPVQQKMGGYAAAMVALMGAVAAL